MFGIFFILAAHEHYSIDVFVAFYISSRLFLYYHTLSNNQALMQRDSTRTRIWFPLFSYFESEVDGIVPNEFETPREILLNIVAFCKRKLNVYKVYEAIRRRGEEVQSSQPLLQNSTSSMATCAEAKKTK